MSDQGPVAVLVHGGFHGGWSWVRVAEPLRRQGWRVFTPSLTGLADRAHLLSPGVGFDTHVQDVLGLIETEELEDVVLVGHSAGGTVITAVADRAPERLAALLYLDASLPTSGQSMLDFMGDSQGVPELFRSQAAESGDGWRVPAGPPFDAAGFGVDDPADAAWVNRRMTDHPLAAFADPVVLTGAWEKVPHKTYIRCEQFQVAHGEPTISKVESDPTWNSQRWACGHSPHIVEPQRVVEAIIATRP
ncbi:MAG TPA: alpha/beta fold hydrolase [Pseudonocardia sp.]|jgi:pimeloyl-ACP methyl ester carboxylesterase|nr:alpha/beta fold hydrolase [Pseudonocardia sp.]